jgi:hypothetical protein
MNGQPGKNAITIPKFCDFANDLSNFQSLLSVAACSSIGDFRGNQTEVSLVAQDLHLEKLPFLEAE